MTTWISFSHSYSSLYWSINSQNDQVESIPGTSVASQVRSPLASYGRGQVIVKLSVGRSYPESAIDSWLGNRQQPTNISKLCKACNYNHVDPK